MKKIIKKIYATSKEEILIEVLGLLFFSISTAYLVTYIVEVG